MTLIVGFPVPGAVVLGADGEEGSAIHKASVRKIEVVIGDGYRCCVAGAGDANFIDLAVQEAREAIAELKPPTLADIRSTLEFVVTEIYTERIDELPERDAENARFELLCGIWAEKDHRAELVKVGRGYCLVRHRPDAIGMGDYLASYLIETLQPYGGLYRRQAERLCVYILAKAKAHVQACGGKSQIIVLGESGVLEEVPVFVVEEDEIATDLVMGGVRMLFNWTDILGWGGNLEKINEVVDAVSKRIKEDFSTRYNRIMTNLKAVAGPPIPPVPKGDPPALPPSPESPGAKDAP